MDSAELLQVPVSQVVVGQWWRGFRRRWGRLRVAVAGTVSTRLPRPSARAATGSLDPV